DNYLIALDQYSGKQIWKIGIAPSYLKYSNNLLYAYTGDKLIVIDKKGNIKWKIDASSEPLFSSGTIYLRSNEGISAINQYTGNKKWIFQDSGNPLLVSNHVVYILSDNTLNALSEDGKLLWKIRAEKILERANGVLYVLSDNYLIALDQYSGKQIWKIIV
ncbi:MAG: PQQ-binding-like beta-propeller repeat protein, partial [Candidatus Hydrothermarchaeota archaeon]